MATSVLPPPGMDVGADQGGRIVASMAALTVIPTIAVMARLLSRHLARAGFWWDDLWVVIALLLSYGPIICVLISHDTNGFGRHIWALEEGEKKTMQFMRILYIYGVFYDASVSAIKICILLFYRRIFPVREIKMVLLIATAAVIAYFFGSLFSSVFQCIPIHKFWHRTTPGHCVNGDTVIIVPGAVNVVLDFFIVALPLPLLWRLRTTVNQKSILTGIFICAGSVCMISIIRLVVLSRLHEADVTWNYVNSGIWSAAEPCMGVVSACLPSLRPLFTTLLRGTPSIRNRSIATNSTTSSEPWKPFYRSRNKSRDNSEGGGGGHFKRLDDPFAKHSRWHRDVTVRGGKDIERGSGDDVSLQEVNVPFGQIRVKDEVVITSTDWLEYKDRVY